jgi:hypothetical protein
MNRNIVIVVLATSWLAACAGEPPDQLETGQLDGHADRNPRGAAVLRPAGVAPHDHSNALPQFGEPGDAQLRDWRRIRRVSLREAVKLDATRRPLRSALHEITFWRPSGEHAALIASLRARWPHEITPAGPAQKHTCFMDAFGLEDPPEIVLTLARSRPDEDGIWISPDFVHYLMAEVLAEVDPARAAVGDVIVYTNRRRPAHAGKVFNETTIRSKWGIGLAWTHRPFEVPLSYGGGLRFFRPISTETAVRAFTEFARSRLRPGEFATLERVAQARSARARPDTSRP